VVRFTPPGKNPRYPLDKRLGGPQSRSVRDGEEKIIPPLPLSRIEPCRLARSLVTVRTELDLLEISCELWNGFKWLKIGSSDEIL
jgi:hypothetical protein